MRSLYSNLPAEPFLNAEAVEAFFSRIGGFTAAREVRSLIYLGDFIAPDQISKMDEQPRWSIRKLVQWIAKNRPTSELERAASVLQCLEARLVSS